MAVNKIVRDCRLFNQNDLWHGIKSLKKSLSQVATGPQFKHEVTWHQELDDKIDPIGTHYHWAVQNCDGDLDKLRKRPLNIVDHYKNQHTNCRKTSQCQRPQL